MPCPWPRGRRSAAPARLVGHFAQNAFHARRAVGQAAIARARPRRRVRPAGPSRNASGSRSRGVGQFVDEALDDPGEDVAARCAPRPHRDAAFDRRLLEQAIRHPAAGELVAGETGAAARLQCRPAVARDAVGKRDEVVVPRRQLATCIERAAQEVETARAIVVVPQVVFARPGELDRRADALRDGRGLDDEVRAQAAAEPTAAAHDVQRDPVLGYAQRASHQVLAGCRVLGGRPDLQRAVAEPRRAVLRLQVGMRDEGVAVRRLHRLRGSGEGRGRVAVLAQQRRAGLARQRLGLGDETVPALRRPPCPRPTTL